MKIVGIVLIVLGAVSAYEMAKIFYDRLLAYGGISYTKREKVLDIGPIEATAETRETIPLPPVLGAIALAGGIVLLVVGSRRR